MKIKLTLFYFQFHDPAKKKLKDQIQSDYAGLNGTDIVSMGWNIVMQQVWCISDFDVIFSTITTHRPFFLKRSTDVSFVHEATLYSLYSYKYIHRELNYISDIRFAHTFVFFCMLSDR